MGLKDIFRKKTHPVVPPVEPPPPSNTQDGTPTNKVLSLRQQGLSNNQIVSSLQREGYQSHQIFDAMNQADIKGGVNAMQMNDPKENADPENPMNFNPQGGPPQMPGGPANSSEDPFGAPPGAPQNMPGGSMSPPGMQGNQPDNPFGNQPGSPPDNNFGGPDMQQDNMQFDNSGGPSGMPSGMNDSSPMGMYGQPPPGMGGPMPPRMGQPPPGMGGPPPSMEQSSPDFGAMGGPMPPGMGPSGGSDSMSERIEEIAEAIIDEKWDQLIKNVNRIVEWKTVTEAKLSRMDQEFNDLKGNFDSLHKAIIGKIGEYDKNILSVGTEIKAMEKVFQKVLPTFTENVSELSRITKIMKKK
ncbi:hypothetical protein K9M79_01680 [Candidatus Woesearchaeota archaeon]|nr:hypothetical protein [Candidatus Woesearchaeota archaeon]